MTSASGLGRKQILVLLIAYLGWVFDIMDMFLLVLVKDSAMKELAPPENAKLYASWALSLTLIGWSVGGLIFGVVADKWGRTRTMALTIVIYSVFTGLCGFSQTWWQLLLLRFIAALGIGGEWGAGASIIAEVFPTKSRAWGAGLLQSASGTGFFAAILLERLVGGSENWRMAFWIGAIPAFLAVLVRIGLSEPETWVAAQDRAAQKTGSLKELFSDPELRRRVIAATGLALFGIAAYWCTNFEANASLVNLLKNLGLDPLSANFKNQKTVGLCVMTAGNIAGFIGFIPICESLGRKWALAIFHFGSLIAMPAAFLLSHDYNTWMILFFIAGAMTSGIYSGYTIMFPELFPTRVRATGAGFCYNVSRVVAAPGPAAMAALQTFLIAHNVGMTDARAVALSGSIMAGLYLFAMPFIPPLPETRGIDLGATSPAGR